MSDLGEAEEFFPGRVQDLSERQRSQLSKDSADQLFMHGLLQQIHLEQDGITAQEDRIQANIRCAMERISSEPNTARKTRSKWVPPRKAAAALFILLLPIYILMNPQEQAAEALFSKILENSKTIADRSYGVEVSTNCFQLKADLVFRGEDKLVLNFDVPFGYQVTVGSNENGAWLAPNLPYSPVKVFEDKKQLQKLVNCAQLQLSYLRLSDFLGVIRESYRVESEQLSSGLVKIVATRKQVSSILPHEIELICDPAKHLLTEANLRWDKQQVDPFGFNQLNEVRFFYRGIVNKEDSFYEHSSHHNAEQTVQYYPER